MTLNDYQTLALETDVFDTSQELRVTDPAFIAKVLGLVGESGEVAEKFKKIVRDREGIVSAADRVELVKELGDVLWYIAVLSRYLGADLEAVGSVNISKLSDRHSRGVIQSSGDNR